MMWYNLNMITHNNNKVTAKTLAKHSVSEHLKKLFDKPTDYIPGFFGKLTHREQDEVLKHISLFEDRIHKTLGVKT